jgi:hypothetical protein
MLVIEGAAELAMLHDVEVLRLQRDEAADDHLRFRAVDGVVVVGVGHVVRRGREEGNIGCR